MSSLSWPASESDLDAEYRKVGGLFIDVLYGLAATQVLRTLVMAQNAHGSIGPDQASAVELSHLGLALGVIGLSYIGYHGNRIERRGGWQIDFFNPAFFQFAIDIAILTGYFLLTAFVVRRTAIPETLIVAVVFMLYVAFDGLDIRIICDEQRKKRSALQKERSRLPGGVVDHAPSDRSLELEADCTALSKLAIKAERSRRNTWVFAPIFFVLAVAIFIADPKSSTQIISVDVLLFAIVLVYRWQGATLVPSDD